MLKPKRISISIEILFFVFISFSCNHKKYQPTSTAISELNNEDATSDDLNHNDEGPHNEEHEREQTEESNTTESKINCNLNEEITILDGESIETFLSETVEYHSHCQSQIRKCQNGSLTGSYMFTHCKREDLVEVIPTPTPTPTPTPCIGPDKVQINHQESKIYYKNSVETLTCQNETRVCNNGFLSGTYQFNECQIKNDETVDNNKNFCSVLNGSSLSNGQSQEFYLAKFVKNGSTCVSQKRTCIAGKLSGVYPFSSCQIDYFINDEQHRIPEGNKLNRLSLRDIGLQAKTDSIIPIISSNGRYVLFKSNSPIVQGGTPFSNLYLKDIEKNLVMLISGDHNRNDGTVKDYDMSDNGEVITFSSSTTNLVANDTNGQWDVFVFNRSTGRMKIVSKAQSGEQSNGLSGLPSISGDGKIISFTSTAKNLTSTISNGSNEIYKVDIDTGVLELITQTFDGLPSNGFNGKSTLSFDGSIIAFESKSNNLVKHDLNGKTDIFINQNGENKIASSFLEPANGSSYDPLLSDTGQFLVFSSYASNLVVSDNNKKSDVFIKNLSNNQIQLVSSTQNGIQGNGNSYALSISNDARFVAFKTDSTNLDLADNNNKIDIYVKDTKTGILYLVTKNELGVVSNENSEFASLSGQGEFITFSSGASNLVENDTNNVIDVFWRKLQY